ncbi:cytochrome C oxidase subunit III [Azoarcus sp. DD4]|uniref:cytochrome c oxidase subunit 3 n=1 Tax=Azoarcus sp. DD4 TaxID=2027405 RepID=UPI00112E5FC7|nr:cytochrome c oxidase subunit 3 [Azoarcus sp. DD4]QDF96294.1 cytochrome C oxidase subunit III [Azoarcus sp. DD4]
MSAPWTGSLRPARALFDALTARPWLPAPAPGDAGATQPAARTGLNVLLGVVTALFALLVVALLIRAQLPDWAALAGSPASPFATLAPLWANTAVLLAGSIAMQFASRAARLGQRGGARVAFLIGGLCALAFLAGQGWVWRQLVAGGHFVAASPALSFFYLLTGLHGLHLAGGLVAWARAARRLWRAAPALSVALCARYWHFLFAVWLVLFGLLASPPPTLRALAEICGVR